MNTLDSRSDSTAHPHAKEHDASTLAQPADDNAAEKGLRASSHHERLGDDSDDDDEQQPSRHGFWSPEVAEERSTYLKGMAGSTLFITLLIWGVLAIYWGSLWKATEKTGELTAWIINRDSPNGPIGNATESVLLASKANNEFMHLNWQVIDPAQYPTPADIEQAIAVDEKAWIAVEITANVSDRLTAARTNGDASWSPRGQVVMYVSEARSNTVIPGYVVAPTQQRIQTAMATLTSRLAGEYITQAQGNTTALAALARAPQTISTPIIPTQNNLRPWNQPVATAPTFVGLIYVVILTLNVTLANFNLRQGLQKKLKTGSLITMRFVVPIVVYFILSWMYTMLNLPFKLNFNGWHLGYGAGVLTYFCATWTGMTVLGLIVECAISIVGPPFIGFFLVLLIIANVSVVVFPIPLQPHFFRYGYGMIFPHLRSIYTAIVFNTGKHVLLLYHFGVIWVWGLVIAVTFPLWIVLE